VATQLNPANARDAMKTRLASVTFSPRVFVAAIVIVLVLAFASVISATHNARRDEDAARIRYQDAEALVALPPASNESVRDDLASVQQQLATAEAGIGAPTIDPASDALTALLVRAATSAGLAVKGVTRADPSQATLGAALYTVQALRITVSGSTTQIAAYLGGLAEEQPALVPSLASMTADKAGVAQADVVFSAYAAVASPTPLPAPTVRAR
jgi:hypothetical protein